MVAVFKHLAVVPLGPLDGLTRRSGQGEPPPDRGPGAFKIQPWVIVVAEGGSRIVDNAGKVTHNFGSKAPI